MTICDQADASLTDKLPSSFIFISKLATINDHSFSTKETYYAVVVWIFAGLVFLFII